MSIKVLIVDDSSVVRQVLQDVLAPCADISVIGAVPDPIFAMTRMRANWPDVVVLDIEMPRMDGISFLRQIMAIRPTPVVICSAQAADNVHITAAALAAGAVVVIAKPALGLRDFLHDSAEALIAAIRQAARHTMPQPRTLEPATRVAATGDERFNADAMLAPPSLHDASVPLTEWIIAIGASTGGPQALELVLGDISSRCPGLVIVQHMPEKFTLSFAKRLNTISPIVVKEAEHHDLVLPGRALVAPGGSHLLVMRDGVQYYVEVQSGPLVNRHRPSIDVLFRSVAKAAGKNAIGIIMTGMGDDGACGMKEMRECGAATFAQDEHSCVVYGMPKEAVAVGGVGAVVALEHISSVINRYGS